MKRRKKLLNLNDIRKAALYARYSSENQRDMSIDAQLRAMHEYCGKHSIEVVEEYCDRAKTGTNDRREEFLRMISDSANGDFEAVIVHKFDRFARNMNDAILYKNELKRRGVRLISVLEPLDDTPESILLESLIFGISDFYSVNLGREVMKGLKENALKCLWTGGKPPLGYDVVDKKMVINPNEAQAVRIIFQMMAEGKGYDTIIRHLNAQGYKTKKGKEFGKNSLYEIIINEKYKGEFCFNKRSSANCGVRNNHEFKSDSEIIRIPNGCPAIVSEQLWDKANSIRKAMRHLKENSIRHQYLLSGLLRCGCCGGRLHGNVKRYRNRPLVYYTYRCNSRENKHNCGCKEIQCKYIEDWVIGLFFKEFFNDNSISIITASINEQLNNSSDNIKLNNAALHLAELTQIRDNLVNAISQTGITGTLSAKYQECEQNIKDTSEIIEQYKKELSIRNVTEAEVEKALNKLRNNLSDPQNLANLKYILSQYIECIEVTNESVAVTFRVPATLLYEDEELKNNLYIHTVAISRETAMTKCPYTDDEIGLYENIKKFTFYHNTKPDNSHRIIEKFNNRIKDIQNSVRSNQPTHPLQKPPTPVYTDVGALVEPRGIEPLSESKSDGFSTRLLSLLKFPRGAPAYRITVSVAL